MRWADSETLARENQGRGPWDRAFEVSGVCICDPRGLDLGDQKASQGWQLYGMHATPMCQPVPWQTLLVMLP